CSPGNKARRVQHTVYLEQYERLEELLKTPFARRASILRKTGPELLFAEAKGNHGLEKYMTRGRPKAQKTSYLIATIQNLKRLMKHIGKGSIANMIELLIIKTKEFFFCKFLILFHPKFV
ncbi:MAG: transposase, partial [Bacteroidota bacterium]|nr:transposase [Bacteroidota bacterium]